MRSPSNMDELDQGPKTFSEFGLSEDVLTAIADMGIHSPTAIQDLCIGPILEKRDVVGKAETGTGKTLGFAAPLVDRIDTQRVATQALVLTPTRELAQQVAQVVEALGASRGLGVVLLVGGVHASEQLMKLRSGSQVVVGTPGRVLDFLRERLLSLVWCELVVLDEADRMLDMGFIDDVSSILQATPSERQTLLFSATIPNEIKGLLKKYMRDPVMLSTSEGSTAAGEIVQQYIETSSRDKFKELCKVLDDHPDGQAIIFCNTRRQTIDLDRMLWGHGYSAGALHGDQEQDVRFKVLDSFRSKDVRVLVCTDVASRGLDIEKVGMVINYEIPDDQDSYVHRIGRTGRARNAGLAISLVGSREMQSWEKIMSMAHEVERVGPARHRRRRSRSRSGEAGESTERGEASRRSPAAKRRRGGRGGKRSSSSRPATETPPPDERRRPRDPEEAAPESESESAAAASQWSRPRPVTEKPKLLRLDEIEDDFVKTDYFDIDESLIPDKPTPTPAARPASSSGQKGKDERGEKKRRPRRRRGGRKKTKSDSDRAASGGDSGAAAERPKPTEGGAEGAADRSSRPRRRRPRRRSRRNTSAKEDT